MKRFVIFSFAFAPLFFLIGRLHAAPDPVTLLQSMEQVIRGKTHEMTASMEIKSPSFTRVYKFKIWMNGVDETLARVLSPAKVEGQGFLKLQTRLWNYIPTAERTILIPPSMMLDRFMGSDFSNDDFVKMSYLPRDYEPRLLGQEFIDGTEVFHLELLPKKDAPVTYGKLMVFLRVEDSAPFRIEFFNEKLEHIRTLFYSEYKSMGGRVIPTVWRMQSNREKRKETTLTILDAKFDTPLDLNIFTQKNLKKYP